jgi:hypothetical protein
VREQIVMRLVDTMAFGKGEIASEQIGHRALLEPLPVESPRLAPREPAPPGLADTFL